MKHLGDITKLNGTTVPPVNVMIGGSPCQDLSVAGTQKGFDGERSVLFMDQIRLIKEMRSKHGKPKYMVWENVPGAFSSNKGADFGAVLTETVRIADPKAPAVPKPKNGWPTAGCLTGTGLGGKWSVAWRVFDAQFWGVPQRRRRIALVADFGGTTAPEILFERESLRRHTQSGGQTRKTTPPPVTDSSHKTSGVISFLERAGCAGSGKGILIQQEKTATLSTLNNQSVCYCIQGNCIDRALSAGCNGKGWTEGVSYTLNTMDRPAVVSLLNDQGGSSVSGNDSATVAPTLRAEMHGNIPAVLALENHPQDSRMKISENNTVQTLSSKMGTGGNNTPMVLALDCMHDQKAVMECQNGIVRRLTPLECERLQGFPDGWTNIGDWIDSKGKVHKCTDSARYKALGNSISIPNWFYVLQRLSVACGADKSMASLFDGIGGFPLIWESFNGKGSCIWASEIEEFPIAVTNMRFKEPD